MNNRRVRTASTDIASSLTDEIKIFSTRRDRLSTTDYPQLTSTQPLVTRTHGDNYRTVNKNAELIKAAKKTILRDKQKHIYCKQDLLGNYTNSYEPTDNCKQQQQ
jgi:hypothetical protein